jgi:hypothetical protein
VTEETKTEQSAENAEGTRNQAEKVEGTRDQVEVEGEGGNEASETVPRPDVARPVIDPPYWPKWMCLRAYHVPLWEAVLLSCNMDPDGYDNWRENAVDPTDRYGFEKVDLRMDISTRVLDQASFDVLRVPQRDGGETILVRLGMYAKWAKEEMEKQSKEVWGKLPDEFERLAVRPEPTWPWGPYTNRKLNALADAVKKFWKDYKKDAPRPKDHGMRDVVKYLTGKDPEAAPTAVATETAPTAVAPETVPTAIAEAIDYIIRPDDWGSGVVKGSGFPKSR